MLEDIDSLIEGIKQHATIDTYARKLYLTGNKRDFEKLKRVLCAFFIWEQLDKKADIRYDTFLANILEEKTLDLPSEISIISWNYDSQIEIAYHTEKARAYRYLRRTSRVIGLPFRTAVEYLKSMELHHSRIYRMSS